MRNLQLNLNHYKAAQHLLMQTVRDLELPIAIPSEYYKDANNGRNWIKIRKFIRNESNPIVDVTFASESLFLQIGS